MNNLMNIEVRNVLIPKADYNEPCRQAFQEFAEIEVPKFKVGKLSVTSKGITFWSVKARDIPYLIAEGRADIGVTGTDNCLEYGTNADRYKIIGGAMGSFSLLTSEPDSCTARYSGSGPINYPVATAYPNLLRICATELLLDLTPVPDFSLSGSIEVMGRLLGTPLAADVISSGASAEINGLTVVQDLRVIAPAIVAREQL